MDINKRKNEFIKHHKHPINIIFHIICGVIYISLFFSLFPDLIYYAYCACVIILFSNIAVGLGLTIVFLLRARIVGISPGIAIGGVLLAYCLPELSHYFTGEGTVLNINTVSAADIVDNFFFLLPHSILALSKAEH
jgi:hypothetical protein